MPPASNAEPSLSFILMLSSGISSRTATLSISAFCSIIFQYRGALAVVSVAAVSARHTSRSVFFILISFIMAVSGLSAIPCDSRYNSPNCPFRVIPSIMSFVLRLMSFSPKASISTCFFSRGRICIFRVICPALSSVSPFSIAETRCMFRFSGNESVILPTLISIPVASEAIDAAFLTAKFCIGGMYIRIDNMMSKANGIDIIIPAHFKNFFMSSVTLCLRIY